MSRKDLAFPTKIRLLDAAVDVFSERGFENGFIREIVDRAGANIAAINYHYGSKDQLAEAVLDFALSGLAAPEAQPEDDPAGRLRSLVGDLLEPDAATRRTGAVLLRLIAWQVVRRAPLVGRLLAAAEWSVFTRARSVVEALRPDLSPTDVALLAWSLIGQLVALRIVETLAGSGSLVETARLGPALFPRALALAEATIASAKPALPTTGPSREPALTVAQRGGAHGETPPRPTV